MSNDPKDLLARALVELRSLRQRLAEAQRAQREPIAVVGLGCRFPGGADSPDALWQLLCDGRDATGDLPPGRWPEHDGRDPEGMYTRRGGWLAAVDGFDARFFGVGEREARSLDPQHRLALEVAWEALEHAAIAPDRLRRTRAGVFFGVSNSDYAHLLARHVPEADVDGYFGPGTALNFVPGRIAYFLGLQGPSLAVDTACSSSLVAVHLACASLRARESDLALAGGVNLILSPAGHLVLCRGRVLSPEGRCKTFDAAADGYARGEGCGVVVLRRLADALADGDRVLAVIRGSAVNQDGPSSGLTVPNPAAQEAVIRDALAQAAVEPAAVDYVEAHGTGTPLGDPIEARALAAALGPGRARPLLLGTVKTNLGHLEAAAGIAGFIKLVLAVERGELPRHLHFRDPNPAIAWDRLPLAVVDTHRPWPDGPRIAGVSSFGASGTNAHVIVTAPDPAPTRTAASPRSADQPAPPRDPAGTPVSLHDPARDRAAAPAASLDAARDRAASFAPSDASARDRAEPLVPDTAAARPRAELLILSAHTPAALRELARRHADDLAARPDIPLADRCWTAATGRARLPHALAIVADAPAPLQAALAAVADDDLAAATRLTPTILARRPRDPVRPVFLFSGQGAQFPGMGRELLAELPAFRAALLQCAELLRPHLPRPLLAVLHPAEGEPTPLDDTAWTQPALFAFEYALACQWRAWGVEPAAVLGHSLGEYVAATVAGVFRLEDVLPLIARRAQHMQALPGGAMAAVAASEAEVTRLLAERSDGLAIAALNGPQETVVAGEHEAVRALLSELARRDIRARQLRVSHAFHSPMLDPALDRFARDVAAVPRSAPRLPLVSNLTGRLAGDEVTRADYYRRHMREPVRFADGLATLRAQGHTLFLEIGPGAALATLGARSGDAATWLPSLRSRKPERASLLETLGALAVRGADVDWPAVHDTPHSRVALPTLPWQRQRHWLRADPPPTALIGRRVAGPPGATFEAELRADRHALLRDHTVYGQVLVSGTVHAALALRAMHELTGAPTRAALDDLEFLAPLLLPPGAPLRVRTELAPDAAGLAFTLTSLDRENTTTIHTRGHVRPMDPTESVPPPRDLAEIVARCPDQLAGDDFYARYWRPDEHALGPSFRTIDHLWRRDGEALARLRPPAIDLDDHAGLGRDALLAACLGEVHGQMLMPAMPGFAAVVPVLEDTFLGRAIARSREYGPPARVAYAHAILRPGDGDELSGDIALLDADGGVLATVEGLRARRIPRALLQRALARGPRPRPRPATPPADRPRVEQYLREQLAALLGGAPDFDPDARLVDLGIDSLMAVDLQEAVRSDLGVTFPLDAALQGDTLANLAERIVATVPAAPSREPADRLGPPDPSADARAVAPDLTAAPAPMRAVAPDLTAAPTPARASAPDLTTDPTPTRAGAPDLADRRTPADRRTDPAALSSPWLRPLGPPVARPRLRLLCFPHSGAGPTAFQPWRGKLPPDVAAYAVQLPGRWDRAGEPPFTRMEPLLDALLPALAPVLEPPFALFGASMGALVAHALTCALRRDRLPLPEQLIVAAYPAPHLPNPLEPHRELLRAALRDDAVDLSALRRLDLIPEALHDPSVLRLLLPALRADFELVLEHTPRPEPPLPLPILALGGALDPEVKRDQLAAWVVHTAADFTLRVLPGGHLFFRTHPDATVQALARALPLS